MYKGSFYSETNGRGKKRGSGGGVSIRIRETE